MREKYVISAASTWRSAARVDLKNAHERNVLGSWLKDAFDKKFPRAVPDYRAFLVPSTRQREMLHAPGFQRAKNVSATRKKI